LVLYFVYIAGRFSGLAVACCRTIVRRGSVVCMARQITNRFKTIVYTHTVNDGVIKGRY